MSRPLRRHGAPPPVRMAHLGLGAFHRSHQAPWTAEVSDWGIAAFSGRGQDLARDLMAQGGVYSLVVRSGDGDRVQQVGAIAQARPGADARRWQEVMADPATALVTLTVTEAAYCLRSSGGLDHRAPGVADDLADLRAAVSRRSGSGSGGGPGASPWAGPGLRTVPARLVAGLAGRRETGGGPMAVVPCDNLPANGTATRRVVLDVAGEVDGDLAAWIEAEVSFVSTVVDRITPATTDDDRHTVALLTGLDDRVPVVTEPWREWVLAGAFPGGRPPWEDAGARFVDDVGPWAERKLRLLNGGHSLLAYAGTLRGHNTVADAVGDATCRAELEAWWQEAATTLPAAAGPADRYCDDLLARFANPRIAHRLAQIALDGPAKLGARVAPVVAARRRLGLPAPAAALVLAAWVAWLRSPAGAGDPAAALATGSGRAPVPALLRAIAPELADDADLVAQVEDGLGRFAG